MAQDRHGLDFSQPPEVTCATNVFEDVPVILQYRDDVLVEIVRMPDGSYTTSFVIFDETGTKLAVVQGIQIYPTAEGSGSGIELSFFEDRTVCRHAGDMRFEIERTGPESLRLSAELHAPDGRLIVVPHDGLPALLERGEPIPLSGVVMKANRFTGVPIALHVHRDGSIIIGGVG